MASAATCWSQSETGGAVWGRVADLGGRAVHGAQVRLENAATREHSDATSDAEGDFHFAGVVPGGYRLLVQARGLSDWEADNLTVGVGTAARLRAVLAPRTLHRTVLVDARLASEDGAAAGSEMGQAWIDSLPNNGQHYSNLAGLLGAASPDGNGDLSFGGLSPLMNSIALDGANNTLAFRSRERGSDGAGFALGQSTVGEFQTTTYGNAAQHGRGGGTIATVTKGGSDRMHGEAVFFDRGAIGQTDNEFTRVMQAEPAGTTATATGQPVQYLNGQPITYVDVAAHAPDRRQQWEVSAGGPIRREQAFWFFSWEEHNRHDPSIARASEPEVFFFPASAPSLAKLEARLARRTITNPLVRNCPLANGASEGSTAAAECAYSAVLNQLSGMLGSVPRSTMQTNWFGKIDWRVKTRSQLELQYSQMRRTSPHGALSGASEMDAIGSFADSSTSDDAALAQWDFVANPRLLNSARMLVSRDVLAQRAEAPSAFEQPLANNVYGMAPQISIDRSAGFTFGTLAAANKREYPAETRIQIADAATWIHGREALRIGYDFNRVRDAIDGLNGENGEYSYASLVDFVSDLLAPNSCDGAATTAGEYPCYSRFRQTLGLSNWWFSTEDDAAWAAGEWKFGRGVTLTAGLRYEYERLPDTNSALVNPAIPQTAKLPDNRAEFGPRAGFSWDVFGRGNTVLRGGMGIHYARVPNAMVFSALTATGSAHSPRSYSWRPMDAGAPPFPHVFAGGETPYRDPNAPDQFSTMPDAVYFDPHFRHPQIENADVELQQALGARMVLTITGMATEGHHLTQFVDANLDQNNWADVFYSVEGPAGTPNSTGDTGPLGKVTGQPGGSSFPIYAEQRLYYRRLNPAYGSITDIESETNSSYGGAMVRLVRRVSRTMSINAGYTWAHAIDDGQNEATFAQRNDVYDPADLRLEHGTSNFDVRQRVSGGIVLREPWRLRGAEGLLLGGYALAGTGEWRTGLPYSMRTMGSIPTPSCSYQDWLAAGGATGNGADCLKVVRQPNATFTAGTIAVPIPALGASLNGSGGEDLIVPIGRNTFRYPEAANLDLRFTKKIRFSDRYSLELMAEGFNALNHQNVTNIQTVGYRLSNDAQHANMAKLIWQNGMKPGSTVELVNGTHVTDPAFDSTAAFGGTTNANSRMLNRERQIQAGIRLFF
jgi:hypothetical protein